MSSGRPIHGISAILLPFDAHGQPDIDGFVRHLIRTREAGLEAAINMDTGFGPQIGPQMRARLLQLTRETLGPNAPFVAGAQPFGHEGDAIEAYRREAMLITELGGLPIIFPSPAIGDVVSDYTRILHGIPRALGFELGQMFAPFGRIFDDDTFNRLLDIEQLIGAKHSSLSRAIELRRLRARDQRRPEFRIYTGNDLAIDLIDCGSDYLLGLSTLDPAAFALRDRWFAENDLRWRELNDALQAVGAVAFRDPVPAYKHSAAVYLDMTGQLPELVLIQIALGVRIGNVTFWLPSQIV